MKKLSKEEINVVIKEVNERIEEKNKLECEKVLSNSKDYSEIEELVNELNKLEDLVRSKVEFINEKIDVLKKEVNFNINLYKENNWSNYKINYYKVERNSYKNYNSMYNKLVLKNISNMLNVEELINELVKDCSE